LNYCAVLQTSIPNFKCEEGVYTGVLKAPLEKKKAYLI